MLPVFLLPETTMREAGEGSALNLGGSQGRMVLLTLGITRIIEQESLDVSIWGSTDGNEWGTPASPASRRPTRSHAPGGWLSPGNFSTT